jgi:predicted dehydrogenase
MDEIRFGVIGLRRGESFLRAANAVGGARVVALHDVDAARVGEVAAQIGAEPYTDLDAFLAADFDVVVVASPMPFHAAQAIAALEADKHVLSEVLPYHTVAEAQALVAAVERSGRQYMLAENCNYYDEIEIVRRLHQQGRFGRVYFAEGDYIHDCDGLWFGPDGELTWRGRGLLGVYGTHGLGPVLAITGDRVVTVRCTIVPAGVVLPDVPIPTMHLLEMTTDSGMVVRTRVDAVSPRPHPSTTYFTIQGTDGSYESARSAQDTGRIWLRDRHGAIGVSSHEPWHPIDDLAAEVIPDRLTGEAVEVGHGTSEYWLLREFCEALRSGESMPIDVHAAMDMTLPCILGRESAEAGGAVLAVPNSRDW